jgi:transglutaminase-like putative cysteine protease
VNYEVRHTTKYIYSETVPVCHNLVRLAPRTLPRQTCGDFRLLIHPDPIELAHRSDYFGNRVSYFSIDQAHRALTVTATSQISVCATPEHTPSDTTLWEDVVTDLRTERTSEVLEAYQFSSPSPHITPFDALADYARVSFRPQRPILEAVLDLTARVHQDFTYDPRATIIQTPIEEVFEKRHGVCQDFAHLQIGCLRSLGLAARYVSGYLRTQPPRGKPRLVGADASHAWLSVYCGEAGWADVDPTNDVPVQTDHITVAWGTDYSDVCPIQGVIVGGGEHRMHVLVDVALDSSSEFGVRNSE